MLEEQDTAFARRTYVRAAFAFIEGLLYSLKVGLLAQETRLPVWQYINLSDKIGRPDRTGKIEFSEDNRLRFVNYCALVIRASYEILGLDPSHRFSDNGWRLLCEALEVRHRLTHPKRPDDFQVSDDEVGCVKEGLRWLLELRYSDTESHARKCSLRPHAT